MSYDQYKPENLMIAGAGGGATTNYGKFQEFSDFVVKRAKAVVTVAGTSTDHGFDFYTGTTSFGTVALGTRAAGQVVDVDLGETVSAPGSLSVKSKADATGKADIVIEIQRNP